MKNENSFSIEIFDYDLLTAIQHTPNLEAYETGHDIIEVENELFVLQVWVNKMYGPAEIECNFGEKVNTDPQTDEYEFDYLDCADFINACKDRSPIVVAVMIFLEFLALYKGA